MSNNNAIYKEALKQLVLVTVAIVLGRLTYGVFFALMVVIGCYAALTKRSATAISIIVFLFAISVLNSFVLPRTIIMAVSVKLGTLLIGICLVFSSIQLRTALKLPLGFLFVYLISAVLSSIYGYSPLVSYLKIIQFVFFLLTIYFGTRVLVYREQELFKTRAFILAIIILFSIGSIMLCPFPQYSTLGGLTIASAEGSYKDVSTLLQIKQHEFDLFCGISFQSQTLAGILSCSWGWIVCDMLFIEQKMRIPHVALAVLIPIAVFMTRSRMGLFALVVTGCVVIFYTMRHIRLPHDVRRKVISIATLSAILALLGAVSLEVYNNSISRWMRKVEDIEQDQRSLSEAVTESRLGLLEGNLYDFRRNPLFGSGFQVAYWHQWMDDKKGLVLSAPIEKGLLPVMVLGETGVLGATVFVIFIIFFISGCVRYHLFLSLTLFWTLFATNIGEATFFSLGGPGGIEWMLTIFGGFVLDLIVKVRNSYNSMFNQPNW